MDKEIQDTQEEVVFTMGSIAESRSKETGYHVKRVAEYSRMLALYYGLDDKEAEMLKQASPMHDIGKVAIPDAILNKPGRFDEVEREVMNTHSQLGYDMLKYSDRPFNWLYKATPREITGFAEKMSADAWGLRLGIEETIENMYEKVSA